MLKREYYCNVCGNKQQSWFKIVSVAGTAFDYNKSAKQMEFGICSVLRCGRCNNYSTVFRKTSTVEISQADKIVLDKRTKKRVLSKAYQMAYKVGNKTQYCLI